MAKKYVEFSDLVAKRTRTLYVPLGKEIGITVDWLPDLVTPALYARMTNRDDEAKDPFVIARQVLAPMITGWDLQRDGAEYPPNEENIANLGLAMVQNILTVLLADFKVATSEDYGETKKDSDAS